MSDSRNLSSRRSTGNSRRQEFDSGLMMQSSGPGQSPQHNSSTMMMQTSSSSSHAHAHAHAQAESTGEDDRIIHPFEDAELDERKRVVLQSWDMHLHYLLYPCVPYYLSICALLSIEMKTRATRVASVVEAGKR